MTRTTLGWARSMPSYTVALAGLALFLGCFALTIAATVADAPGLIAVAVLYGLAVVAVWLRQPQPHAVAFGLGATIGVAVPGLVSYGFVLLPAIGVWGWTFIGRGQPCGRGSTLLALFIGASVGLWAVLLPVMVGRSW